MKVLYKYVFLNVILVITHLKYNISLQKEIKKTGAFEGLYFAEK